MASEPSRAGFSHGATGEHGGSGDLYTGVTGETGIAPNATPVAGYSAT
jgi:hypothetical protein